MFKRNFDSLGYVNFIALKSASTAFNMVINDRNFADSIAERAADPEFLSSVQESILTNCYGIVEFMIYTVIGYEDDTKEFTLENAVKIIQAIAMYVAALILKNNPDVEEIKKLINDASLPNRELFSGFTEEFYVARQIGSFPIMDILTYKNTILSISWLMNYEKY